MPNNEWLGGASAAAMVKTGTPGGTIEAGDKFITIIDDTNGNSETLSVSATGTTVAQVCDDILAAIAALPATSLFHTLVTVTDETTHVKFTAATSGVPFELTLSSTESNDDPADDQTYVEATTVARSGPNDVGVAANWSLGAVPVNSDDLIINQRGAGYALLYGLAALAAVTLNALKQSMAFTGATALIGDGDDYLQVSSAASKTHTLGYQFGGTSAQAGPPRVMLDFGSVATTVNVRNSASSSPSGEEMKQVMRLLFNSSSSVLNLLRGKVGLAANAPGETTTIGTINQSYVTSQATDADLVLGPGVTVTTINKTGGVLVSESLPTTLKHSGGTAELVAITGTLTTLNLDAGQVETNGAFALTAANVKAGTLISNSTGTVTAINMIGEGGLLDLLRSNAPRTITTITVTGACTIRADSAVVTVTNKIALSGSRHYRVLCTPA